MMSPVSSESPTVNASTGTEIAVALPENFDAGIYFIGRIRTPWTQRDQCPKNARGSDAVCMIELDPRYTAALDGVAGCSHLVVLYFMHEARRDLLVQAPRHHPEPRGTFSVRSPVRPNPIAMSVAKLVRVEGTALSVVALTLSLMVLSLSDKAGEGSAIGCASDRSRTSRI